MAVAHCHNRINIPDLTSKFLYNGLGSVFFHPYHEGIEEWRYISLYS
jgi:hypothetical protein